jgi:uncharacterized membrane protein
MYCGNCGKQIEDGMAFCPTCGKSIGASTQGGAKQTAAGDNTKTMSVIAYFMFFVPLLAGTHKTSEAVRFHTNQGTVLFIAASIYGVVYAILAGALGAVLMWKAPGVAAFLIALLSIPYLGFLVLWIIGIVNAVQGRQQPLPLIGKIIIIK